MSPLGYRRSTPVAVPVVDSRAARGTMRALALLVDRISTLQMTEAQLAEAATRQPSVRDALRQLTGRIREAPLVCRFMDGEVVFEGEPVDRALTRDDPLVSQLLTRCLALRIGSIAVRQGASPGELLSLAALMVRAPRGPDTAANPATATGPGSVASETPTTMSSIVPEGAPRELLRSWSVLVMPADTPRGAGASSAASSAAASGRARPEAQDGRLAGGSHAAITLDDEVLDSARASSSPVAIALSRLAAANSDTAASSAADQVMVLIAEAEQAQDAVVLEAIARSVMAQIRTVGAGAGRLALERLVRRLQERSALVLLAQTLPTTVDRLPLLELLARAGELAVDVLVQQLLAAEDSSARRAYFDSIVSLDLGATQLFALTRDSRWFVVRNAVAILGEMGVETADDVIVPLLGADDERVRIASARALIRLGTVRALQGLHAAVDDPHAEVRRIAAVAYGLSGSAQSTTGVRPPAGRLAAALEREMDEEVAIEMVASLGRLGSADAIQRLLRIALPPASLPDGQVDATRREPWLRVAAIEALVRARGHAVRDTIDALINDPDTEVAATALQYRS